MVNASMTPLIDLGHEEFGAEMTAAITTLSILHLRGL